MKTNRLSTTLSRASIGTQSRRTQEERSETTQHRIYEAAIAVLHAEGYAAATTQAIAERAGVSRGAMLHHFPTKVDLMLAVVRIAHESDLLLFRHSLAKFTDPLERYFALPDLAWEVLSRPSGIAVLEIMMSSRSNPTLAERLAPLQAKIEAESQNRVLALARNAGLHEDASSRDFSRLVVAAVRGFSIEAMFHRNPKRIASALNRLKILIREHQLSNRSPIKQRA